MITKVYKNIHFSDCKTCEISFKTLFYFFPISIGSYVLSNFLTMMADRDINLNIKVLFMEAPTATLTPGAIMRSLHVFF